MLTNLLIRKGDFCLPVVEQTPLIWKNHIILIETWDEAWEETPWNYSVPRCKRQYIRVRDESSGKILSRFMRGYGYSSAIAIQEKVYVFASTMSEDSKQVSSNVLSMVYSDDLVHWGNPRIILSEPKPERLFNTSVCYDGNRFVMAYESDCDVYFTLKFAESGDLINWKRIPDSFLGRDRYTACPAIRFANPYYYVMYLDWDRIHWWFETRIARSYDMINWEISPHKVIVPDRNMPVHPDCPEHSLSRNCDAMGMECNASDPDLIEWNGHTRVYFTGGCQHYGGRLQYAEFDGLMDAFLESYFC